MISVALCNANIQESISTEDVTMPSNTACYAIHVCTHTEATETVDVSHTIALRSSVNSVLYVFITKEPT
jgi:hypothetical protein